MKRLHEFCLNCGARLYGRKDRKFCSLKCKNTFNNDHHVDSSPSAIKARTLKILNQNHRILTDAIVSNRTTVDIGDLVANGFNPAYNTSCKRGHNGDEMHCFDIKYRQSAVRIFNIGYSLKLIPIEAMLEEDK